ncbi:MAG: glycosyltransferase [Phycisphaerae bacterium]
MVNAAADNISALEDISSSERERLDALLGRSSRDLNVWLVHDWLTGMRGGEKVLLELVRLFPSARIATLFHVPGSVHPAIESRIRSVSWLQRIPSIEKRYRSLLPLMPLAIQSVRIDSSELVLSTSHCVAKNVRTRSPHLCHCFTPMRYIWDMQDAYLQSRGTAVRLALRGLTPWLRHMDCRGHRSVNQFVGTCRNVCQRIERIYQRPSLIVHSPIDETYFRPADESGREFFLVVSALVEYKRIDLAVEFFSKLNTLDRRRLGRLVVIGTGPDMTRLQEIAARSPGNVEFKGWQDDAAVRWHYQNARALIFPGEEDFGLVPIEAMACGRPVIAFGRGGILETAVPLGESPTGAHAATAVFFQQQSLESFQAAMEQFVAGEREFNPRALHARAMQFGRPQFRSRIAAIAGAVMNGKTNMAEADVPACGI